VPVRRQSGRGRGAAAPRVSLRRNPEAAAAAPRAGEGGEGREKGHRRVGRRGEREEEEDWKRGEPPSRCVGKKEERGRRYIKQKSNLWAPW